MRFAANSKIIHRIICGDTVSSSTIAAYERRIEKLEREKLILAEKLNSDARLDDNCSNALFETLEDWESYLKAENIKFPEPERPVRKRKLRGPSL